MTRRSAIALLLVAACGGRAPRPHELETLRELQREPRVGDAMAVAPEQVRDSQALAHKSEAAWKLGNQYESRRDALMGLTRLKAALALLEQDRARKRVRSAEKETTELIAEQARLELELATVQDKLNLLGRVASAEQAAGSEKQRGGAQQAIASGALAIRNADAVEARTYAAADFGEAQSLLSKAQQALQSGDSAQASSLAAEAQRKAEQASVAAKPFYEKSQAAQGNKARDEALMRDAAAIPGMTLRLERRGDLTRVILPLADLFAGKKSTIRPSKESLLDSVAELVKKYPAYAVQIVGHTDSRGRHASLLVLSQARAQAVYDALLGRGAEPRRFTVSGKGPDSPVSDNRTKQGRAQNNRVEVIFLVQ